VTWRSGDGGVAGVRNLITLGIFSNKNGWILDNQQRWVDLPSGYVKIAIEHGTFIVDFPIKNGDFP
jgi:hypothetical protein